MREKKGSGSVAHFNKGQTVHFFIFWGKGLELANISFLIFHDVDPKFSILFTKQNSFQIKYSQLAFKYSPVFYKQTVKS